MSGDAPSRSRVTTHVLDAASGHPATGVTVTLESFGAAASVVASGVTDADGRISHLGPVDLAAGSYQLRFDTGGYFAARGVPTFYPEVVVTFVVADGDSHYHVPLLLSPYAYSTYRGS